MAVFVVFDTFSMFKITKRPTMIGFDWSRIRKVLNGLENVGCFKISLNMSLT